MPTHAEQCYLPFTAEQMFDLVADVERYPEFLPWCVGARIKSRDGGTITADMMIGFRVIRERFTSKATFDRPDRIDVEYLNGPFRYLKNRWVFAAKDDGCMIDFYIDFEFHSRIMRLILEPLFGEAVRRMVSAFESRARALYGAPEGDPSPSRA